jgi:hypothetical protein
MRNLSSYFSPLSLLLTFWTFLIGFSILWIKYFDHVQHPPNSLILPSPFPLVSTPKQILFYTVSFIFSLDLDPTYEKEQANLSFSVWLILINMNSSHVNPFPCKWQNFTLLYNWIILHCMYVCIFIYMTHFVFPFIGGYL